MEVGVGKREVYRGEPVPSNAPLRSTRSAMQVFAHNVARGVATKRKRKDEMANNVVSS
jgi:hypothetical protein